MPGHTNCNMYLCCAVIAASEYFLYFNDFKYKKTFPIECNPSAKYQFHGVKPVNVSITYHFLIYLNTAYRKLIRKQNFRKISLLLIVHVVGFDFTQQIRVIANKANNQLTEEGVILSVTQSVIVVWVIEFRQAHGATLANQ